ncbi:hypothetical protein [Vibrio sp. R78045]|uniref:hypothetical protein n=1 Tax=Vibrio sp. R78045 TaxID=3093868 RepID=UPI0036F1D949
MYNSNEQTLSHTTGVIIQHVAEKNLFEGGNDDNWLLLEELGRALQADADVSAYTFTALYERGFHTTKYSTLYIADLALRFLKSAGRCSFEVCWAQTEKAIEESHRPEPPVSGCLYKLHHHYDIGDQSVYFSFANSQFSAVDLAVYVQIKAEELLDDSITLDNQTILRFLTLFGAKEYNGKRQHCRKVDMYSDREFRTKEWDECTFPKLDEVCGELAVAFLRVDEATMTQAKVLDKAKISPSCKNEQDRGGNNET